MSLRKRIRPNSRPRPSRLTTEKRSFPTEKGDSHFLVTTEEEKTPYCWEAHLSY